MKIMVIFTFLTFLLIGCSKEILVNNEIVAEGFEYYTQLALDQDDISQCDNLNDDLEMCKAYYAISKSNSEICLGLSEEKSKSTCILGVAYKNKDFSLCYSYDFAAKVASAISGDKGDYSEKEIINSCNHLIINQNLDPSLCEPMPLGAKIIGDISWPDYCYGIIGAKLHKKENCDKIDDTNSKKLCLAYSFEDLPDCEISKKQDICYFDSATFSKNPAFCEMIKMDSLKNSCYFEISLLTKDKNLCDKAIDKKLGCLAYLKDN